MNLDYSSGKKKMIVKSTKTPPEKAAAGNFKTEKIIFRPRKN